MNINFNELRDKAYKCACDHGFHDKEYSDEHWLMLIITEISEAVNSDRKGHHAKLDSFEKAKYDLIDKYPDNKSQNRAIFNGLFEKAIKDSIEDEISDVAIRLLDFAGVRKCEFCEQPIPKYLFDEDKSFCENCYYLIWLFMSSFIIDHVPICDWINDAISLVFELAKLYSIDLLKFIDLKMRYNEFRPYKNGKNY